MTPPTLLQRFRDLIARPVHGGSLAAFRIAFGGVMALQGRALLDRSTGASWIARRLEGPEVGWTVPFPGLEWLRPLPAPWMSVAASAVIAAGMLLALGLLPRLAALVVLVAWSWIWLSDQTLYNNHWYLMSLFAIVLAVVPSGRCYSLTSAWRRLRCQPAEPFVPYGSVLTLRGQLLLVYFFGGLTKVTADTLLRAEPVRSFLADARLLEWAQRSLDPAAAARLGAWLTDSRTAFAFAWSGLAYDLAIGPLLLVRRTRLLALVLTAIFHLLNHAVLFGDIGYFPLLGFTATLIFLDPDWPDRVLRWLKRPRLSPPDWGWFLAGFLLVPVVGAALGFKRSASPEPQPPRRFALGRGAAAAIAVWFALQLALPLRHWFYPGDVNWTSEGLLFGWRMKTNLVTRDLYAVLVEDPAAAAGGDEARRGPPAHAAYQHVDAPRVDWTRLPELLVVYERPFGERLVYNPMSGGQTRTLDEARRRLDEIGMEAFGRTLVSHETRPIYLALRAHEKEALAHGDKVAAALREARVYAMSIALLAPPEPDLYLQSHRLRQRLEELLAMPEHKEWLREALARAHPLSASGAPDPKGSFLVVEDPLVPLAYQPLVGERAPSWAAALGTPAVVLADFRRLTLEDWRRFPKALPLAGSPGGGALYWWNVPRDLPDAIRRSWVLSHPGALQLYARRVARAWEQEYGRWPRVRARCYVSINRLPPRPIVDPTADLAALPVTWLRHDPWRLPPVDAPDPALAFTY